MDIRVKFPFRRPIILDDDWPLRLADATLTFERKGNEALGLIVTFRNKPTSAAPTVTPNPQGKVVAHIHSRGEFEAAAQRIARRFRDYASLVFPIDVELGKPHVEYLPANEDEKSQLNMFSFSTSYEVPKTMARFNILAQAAYAVEGPDDPSFASNLSSMAREALSEERYIEAFRYAFLLVEAMYGNGKFKKAQLVSEMKSNAGFMRILATTMRELSHDRHSHTAEARTLIQTYQKPEAMIEHLVERRGFYFHGNVARSDAWHPDKHQDAKAIGELATHLAAAVAFTFSGAMFRPENGNRYFEDAQAGGAIMNIEVDFGFVDRNGVSRSGKLNVSVPGNVLTNGLALSSHKQFLDWAETELYSSQLTSAVAREKESGREIFRSDYPVLSGGTAAAPSQESDT